MIIITSKSYKRYLSLFFYRNFYFFINILFFFIKNNTVYRRSITINKIHPFLTQWKPYLTKRQGPGVSQLILGNSEPLDDSKARSKGQKKPERPFLWHVERTKMAGHFFHAKGARFANGSTINGAFGKNFQDDTCTWDARQTANLRRRTAYNHRPFDGFGPSSVYGAPTRFWFICPRPRCVPHSRFVSRIGRRRSDY